MVRNFAGKTSAFVATSVRRLMPAIRDASGATLVEYGLLIALVAIVVAAGLSVLGVRVRTAFCPVITLFGGACS